MESRFLRFDGVDLDPRLERLERQRASRSRYAGGVPADASPPDASPRLWRRLRVLVAGLALLSLLAFALANGRVHPWLQILASWLTPLALDTAHWSMGVSGWLLFSANVALLLAHPLRPNLATAILTSIGLLFWLLMGLSIAFVSV